MADSARGEKITDEQVMEEIENLGRNGRIKEVNKKMRQDPSIMRGILKTMEKNQDIARQAKRAAQHVHIKDSGLLAMNTIKSKKQNNIYAAQNIALQKKAKNYKQGDFDCVYINQKGKLCGTILNSNNIEDDVYTVIDINGKETEEYTYDFKYTVIESACFVIVFNCNPEIQRCFKIKNRNAMTLANLNKDEPEHITFKGCVWFMLLDENDNHVDICVENFKKLCLAELNTDIFYKKKKAG